MFISNLTKKSFKKCTKNFFNKFFLLLKYTLFDTFIHVCQIGLAYNFFWCILTFCTDLKST
jgi:hypothetical protein